MNSLSFHLFDVGPELALLDHGHDVERPVARLDLLRRGRPRRPDRVDPPPLPPLLVLPHDGHPLLERRLLVALVRFGLVGAGFLGGLGDVAVGLAVSLAIGMLAVLAVQLADFEADGLEYGPLGKRNRQNREGENARDFVPVSGRVQR